MPIFDSHSHYNDEKFDIDRKQILDSLKEHGIEKIIVAGYNIASSQDAINLSEQYDFIYAICGISPNDIEPTNDLDKIKQLAKNKKVVAIGEIGLDYYWNKDNKNEQKELFIKQINLANELKLPIVIHSREAVQDTIDILKQNEVIKKGVFHCSPLNEYLVTEALKLGYYISFAGPVTFKNSKNAQNIVNMVPIEKMLIETDTPYLSPEPERGKRNDSTKLKYIIEKIAEYKGVEKEVIENATYQNALKIFNIE